MKNILAIISVSFFISFHPIYAQWIQTNGPSAGPVDALTASGANILAGIYQGGVYLTTNNGQNWTLSFPNNQSKITSFAVNDTNIFASAYDGVYYSTNSGQNWVQTAFPGYATSVAIRGSFVFGGSQSTYVYRSGNNGQSWTEENASYFHIYSMTANDSNIFAGSFSIFRSTNNGQTWTSSYGVPVFTLVSNGPNIFGGGYIGAVRSTDNGVTWAQTPVDNLAVYSLAVSGTNVFAGTAAGVYFSSDNGLNYSAINEGIENQTINSLLVLGNYAYAGTHDGIVWKRSLSEITGINNIAGTIPKRFGLFQNYPNPFNPATKIRFALPKNSFVNLVVYDMLGRKLETTVNSQLNAGTYEIEFDGSKYSSGIYFYVLKTESFTETKKMALTK